jgi:hypothetical protein
MLLFIFIFKTRTRSFRKSMIESLFIKPRVFRYMCYIALNRRVIMNWEENGRQWSLPILRHSV